MNKRFQACRYSPSLGYLKKFCFVINHAYNHLLKRHTTLHAAESIKKNPLSLKAELQLRFSTKNNYFRNRKWLTPQRFPNTILLLPLLLRVSQANQTNVSHVKRSWICNNILVNFWKPFGSTSWVYWRHENNKKTLRNALHYFYCPPTKNIHRSTTFNVLYYGSAKHIHMTAKT